MIYISESREFVQQTSFSESFKSKLFSYEIERFSGRHQRTRRDLAPLLPPQSPARSPQLREAISGKRDQRQSWEEQTSVKSTPVGVPPRWFRRVRLRKCHVPGYAGIQSIQKVLESHPGVEVKANPRSISHRRHLFEPAFV